MDYDDGGVIGGVVGGMQVMGMLGHGGGDPGWQQRVFVLALMAGIVVFLCGGAWLELRRIERGRAKDQAEKDAFWAKMGNRIRD